MGSIGQAFSQFVWSSTFQLISYTFFIPFFISPMYDLFEANPVPMYTNLTRHIRSISRRITNIRWHQWQLRSCTSAL
jgi:hypothetical protein